MNQTCLPSCVCVCGSDCFCEENEGRRDQQLVKLTRLLQEVQERGRGARGVSAFSPARPQGRAVMTPCGQTLSLHHGHNNDEWGPKAKISQAPLWWLAGRVHWAVLCHCVYLQNLNKKTIKYTKTCQNLRFKYVYKECRIFKHTAKSTCNFISIKFKYLLNSLIRKSNYHHRWTLTSSKHATVSG